MLCMKQKEMCALLVCHRGSSGEVQTGASYIRWGRTTCENNASLVYSGNINKRTYMYFTCIGLLSC